MDKSKISQIESFENMSCKRHYASRSSSSYVQYRPTGNGSGQRAYGCPYHVVDEDEVPGLPAIAKYGGPPPARYLFEETGYDAPVLW